MSEAPTGRRLCRSLGADTPWACALAVGLVLLGPVGRAQTPTKTIEERVAALEAEVRRLRAQLSQPRADPGTGGTLPAVLSIVDAATRGASDAGLVLVEFSDYECPFCGRYARDTFPQIDERYVKTGKLRYVFKNFPIEQLHPHALKAAQAAECAGAQGPYWPMHDRLFARQDALSDEALIASASAEGLTISTFMACLGQEVGPRIRQHLEEGRAAGVEGTPTFFLGTPGPDGTVRVTRRLTGALPYMAFEAAIDEALRDADRRNNL
ncbi:MAG: DsbA family protein [Vicinamibacterales bacterium]